MDIDIVVTYVDDNEPTWQEKYKRWKDIEIKTGKVKSTSLQAFGAERTRTWDFMRYWFRAVEINCPWVHNIFFVIQDKEQIPTWLNLSNPKLKVVYHKDFIPQTLLPTFNGRTIDLFLCQIPDLSENYIVCNDDFFFLNTIQSDRLFKNGMPRHEDNRIEYGRYFDHNEFLHVMNNCLELEEKYMSPDNKIKYFFYHLPTAHNKSFDQRILKDNYKEIYIAQEPSKFRFKTNFDANIYVNIFKLLHPETVEPKGSVYYNCAYVTISSKVDFNNYKNLDMVCFNDTDSMDDFIITKTNLISFLQQKFPKQSSFEKEG